jgi:hypothetical protein
MLPIEEAIINTLRQQWSLLPGRCRRVPSHFQLGRDLPRRGSDVQGRTGVALSTRILDLSDRPRLAVCPPHVSNESEGHAIKSGGIDRACDHGGVT